MNHTSIDFRAFAPLEATRKKLAERGAYAKHFRSFTSDGKSSSIQGHIELLDELGISQQVVTGAGAPLEELAALVSESDRFIGIADISPSPCMDAVETVRQACDMGLRLIGLTPYREGLPASDRQYYPVYGKCCELGLGVIIHASTQLSSNCPMNLGHPSHLDQVAIDFPHLVIVASHGGWPWVGDMTSIAMRHANVFIELSGQRTKYYGVQGSGWEVLLKYAQGPLKKKIVWGSTAPFFDLAAQFSELGELGLSEDLYKAIVLETPIEILKRCGSSPYNRL